MTTIGDIFDIPNGVHQGDFVLRLTEGLQGDRRRETLQQYVVTPQLVGCFDRAMQLIGGAVDANSSKRAYLHGSFGSGKSHFMAVLDVKARKSPSWSRPAMAIGRLQSCVSLRASAILRELIGKSVPGAEQLAFADVRHWGGRRASTRSCSRIATCLPSSSGVCCG